MMGGEVTLEQMLKAREWRAGRQRALAAEHGQMLVCLTLNIAGPVKRTPLADRAFDEAAALIGDRLMGAALCERRVDDTGYFGVWRADGDPLLVKRRMCAVEEDHPLGRLLDIDVLDASAGKIERAALGLPARRCLICGGEAHACARSRAHSVVELQGATHRLLKGYFDAKFAGDIQQAATKALLYELSATPKPGLVDRAGSGAHADMDFTSFIDSIAALGKYFRMFALQGIGAKDERALFESLRFTGKQAERDMLRATGGANTHRGVVFTLGLIAGACGLIYGRGKALTVDGVLSAAARLARHSLGELKASPRAQTLRGAGGARAQAAAGFPSVRDVALPELGRWLARGESANDASVAALLSLIAHVEDTNLMARSNPNAAAAIRADVRARLGQVENMPGILRLAEALDKQFTAANLSPGGSADLLAAAWMLRFVGTEETKEEKNRHVD